MNPPSSLTTIWVSVHSGECLPTGENFRGLFLFFREIVFYMKDMINNNHIDLDLTRIPVIEDDAEKAPFLELKALIASLRYDKRFRRFNSFIRLLFLSKKHYDC